MHLLDVIIIILHVGGGGGVIGITLSVRLFVYAIVSGPCLTYVYGDTMDVSTSHKDCL